MSMKDFEQYYQGDIWFMALPDEWKVTFDQEIPVLNGKLIIQEGELTGHHHSIDVMDRPSTFREGMEIPKSEAPRFKDTSLNKMFFDKEMVTPTARLYRGNNVATELVEKNILLRADLVIGLLHVTEGPVKVTHQEHNSVVLGPGRYVCGRQIESVAGEERRVAD